MKNALRNTYKTWIIEHADINFKILFVSLTEIWFAFILFQGVDTFEGRSFLILKSLLSEDALGIIFVILAFLFMLSGIVRRRKLLRAVSIIQSVFWTILSLCILFASGFTTVLGLTAFIALACWIVFLRVKYI